MQKHRLHLKNYEINFDFDFFFFSVFLFCYLPFPEIRLYVDFGLQTTFQPCLMKKSTRKFEFVPITVLIFIGHS